MDLIIDSRKKLNVPRILLPNKADRDTVRFMSRKSRKYSDRLAVSSQCVDLPSYKGPDNIHIGQNLQRKVPIRLLRLLCERQI